MLAGALLVAAPASTQVYKCTDNGTVYSGMPCERGAKAVDLGNTSASGNVSAEDAERQSRFRRLIQLKKVAKRGTHIAGTPRTALNRTT